MKASIVYEYDFLCPLMKFSQASLLSSVAFRETQNLEVLSAELTMERAEIKLVARSYHFLIPFRSELSMQHLEVFLNSHFLIKSIRKYDNKSSNKKETNNPEFTKG